MSITWKDIFNRLCVCGFRRSGWNLIKEGVSTGQSLVIVVIFACFEIAIGQIADLRQVDFSALESLLRIPHVWEVAALGCLWPFLKLFFFFLSIQVRGENRRLCNTTMAFDIPGLSMTVAVDNISESGACIYLPPVELVVGQILQTQEIGFHKWSSVVVCWLDKKSKKAGVKFLSS